jgi:hypothetical protein
MGVFDVGGDDEEVGRALQGLALADYRVDHISKAELPRLLGVDLNA